MNVTMLKQMLREERDKWVKKISDAKGRNVLDSLTSSE